MFNECDDCGARILRIGPLHIGVDTTWWDWHNPFRRRRRNAGIPPIFAPEIWNAATLNAAHSGNVLMSLLRSREYADRISKLGDTIKLVTIDTPWRGQPFTGADANRWSKLDADEQAAIDYGLLGPVSNEELDTKHTIAWG